MREKIIQEFLEMMEFVHVEKSQKDDLIWAVSNMSRNCYRIPYFEFDSIIQLLNRGNNVSALLTEGENLKETLAKAKKSLKNTPQDSIIVYVCSNGKEYLYDYFDNNEMVENYLGKMMNVYSKVDLYTDDSGCDKVKVVILTASRSGFVRRFDSAILEKLNEKNLKLYNLLKEDVLKGEVFPAIRKNEIHFYYKGGLLYKLQGTIFLRDKEYEKYSKDTEGLCGYEKAKMQNFNKFSNSKGSATERMLLDEFNSCTFNNTNNSSVMVIDIEVRLNGNICGNKKCDMVLLNNKTGEIMFVEGKVFSDKRVNVSVGILPEVIEQVNNYSAAIKEQEERIEKEYSDQIWRLYSLFGAKLKYNKKLIKQPKLLVLEVPQKLSKNNEYSINVINEKIGKNNVVWFTCGEKPSLEDVWERLCK